VAQLIALTTWANAFLRKGFDPAGLNRDHATLKICNKVAFADIRGLLKSREVPVAADPLTWLKLLREEGCQAVRLLWFPRPDEGDGADAKEFEKDEPGWALECHREGAVDHWRCRWELTNRYAPQNRSWSVVYTRVERNIEPTAGKPVEFTEVRERLSAALQECCAFANSHKQAAWEECLVKARSLLENPKPFDESDHVQLLPRVGGTLTARQALACSLQALSCKPVAGASSQADVDSDEGAATIQRLTETLHAAITQSVEPAANAWADGP